MTSSFREGGRGQPKDDSGLCGGSGGLKPPKKAYVIFEYSLKDIQLLTFLLAKAVIVGALHVQTCRVDKASLMISSTPRYTARRKKWLTILSSVTRSCTTSTWITLIEKLRHPTGGRQRGHGGHED